MGGFVVLNGRFYEILYNTNIILLTIVLDGDTFKCVHTSGQNGLLKDYKGFKLINSQLNLTQLSGVKSDNDN